MNRALIIVVILATIGIAGYVLIPFSTPQPEQAPVVPIADDTTDIPDAAP